MNQKQRHLCLNYRQTSHMLCMCEYNTCKTLLHTLGVASMCRTNKMLIKPQHDCLLDANRTAVYVEHYTDAVAVHMYRSTK